LKLDKTSRVLLVQVSSRVAKSTTSSFVGISFLKMLSRIWLLFASKIECSCVFALERDTVDWIVLDEWMSMSRSLESENSPAILNIKVELW
jgi:hypothetical protein